MQKNYFNIYLGDFLQREQHVRQQQLTPLVPRLRSAAWQSDCLHPESIANIRRCGTGMRSLIGTQDSTTCDTSKMDHKSHPGLNENEQQWVAGVKRPDVEWCCWGGRQIYDLLFNEVTSFSLIRLFKEPFFPLSLSHMHEKATLLETGWTCSRKPTTTPLTKKKKLVLLRGWSSWSGAELRRWEEGGRAKSARWTVLQLTWTDFVKVKSGLCILFYYTCTLFLRWKKKTLKCQCRTG